ncbi:bifunctional aspartate kinase/homoserine dehydrogenase I [Candidatus Deianiraea vastatrix]|uniref:Aspartokinase n=1 Tax=Candidatus Deianiraea vastatrix TaxID=2163644 RepID=A0A5B8XEW0_9RICK|nr:bifunctional aspartate kinase/homoserine dehydrogenase I [Candidatus Deianiraea vastatrix]QED23822.1 Bifunctional aspartokinase/homoserine dehydrogenase [Candidatus Deianiraea vastatrix]
MLEIYKFGGSILKNADDIRKIADIIIKDGNKINIFSALHGVTDGLIKIAEYASKKDVKYISEIDSLRDYHLKICSDLGVDNKEIGEILIRVKDISEYLYKEGFYDLSLLDLIVGYGEILSSNIVYLFLAKDSSNIELIDAKNCIRTDSTFTSAKVDFEATSSLCKNLVNIGKINIITGFIASDGEGRPTTLGRNGSDYTAALLGKIFSAGKIVIWKDVDGVFTANPKIVSNAIQISKISYKEMSELSYFGNKVVSLMALSPAISDDIPICIRGLYNITNEGTLISSKTDEEMGIKGITAIEDVSLININSFNILGIGEFLKQVFSAINKANINIIMISQSSSESSISICVRSDEINEAIRVINSEFTKEIRENIISIDVKNNQSIVAVAGFKIANQSGLSGKIFSNLGLANININAISQGLCAMSISFAVDSSALNLCVKLIHNSIFENKCVNCLIIGNGVVGSSVIKMINSQRQYFLEKGIDLRIIGYANSKEVFLPSGESFKYSSYDEIISWFSKEALIHYVLIDCTSSDDLVANYRKFIDHGFNIVTPNKKANTLNFDEFEKLQNCLKVNKKYMFYEANVGAGLPIISTIKDLIDCGDEIVKIEGIFSGTLSYIFNNLSNGVKFSDIVKMAKENGFTEPDPRDDLCGMDVARKLLILARMIGYRINLSDLKIQNLVDATDEQIFEMFDSANKENKTLRYVGLIEDGKASAKIIAVDNDSPLASTKHTDNIISITTKFYNKTPLVIRGAGAGADVTAIGVVSDLIKLANILL